MMAPATPAVVQAVSAALMPLTRRHEAAELQAAVAFVLGGLVSVAARNGVFPTREAAIEGAVASLSAGLIAEPISHFHRTPPAGRA